MNSREVMQQAREAIRIFREWETGQDYESCRATVLALALAAEESLGAALAEFGADPQNVGQTQTESKQEPVIDGYPLWSGMPQRQPQEPSRAMLEALQIIATPQRPDGTWNRDREACRQLAAEALGFHNKGDWK